MINCNEIQQNINASLIAFADCKKYTNSDLTTLVELIQALNDCDSSGSLEQNNKFIIISYTLAQIGASSFEDNIPLLLAAHIVLQNITVNEIQLYIFKVQSPSLDNQTYILNDKGKGSLNTTVAGDLFLLIDNTFNNRDIPLNGTKVGSPITGKLQTDSVTALSSTQSDMYIGIANNPDLEDTSTHAQIQFSSSEHSKTTSLTNTSPTGINTTLSIQSSDPVEGFESIIKVFSNDPLFRGLSGEEDYTPNITELDYTQKKYVDDLVATVTGIFFGSVEPIDTPTGTDAGYWIATEAGTYTNFGGVVVNENSIAVISRRETGDFTISQTEIELGDYAKKELLEDKADLITGKNKFNKDTAVIGSYITDTNSVFTNATYDYSDFIPVTPGVQYKSNFNIRFSCYYDVNQNVVAGGLSAESSTFTPPAGAVYTKITIFHTDINLFQLEIGTVSTAFESYKKVVPSSQLDLTNYVDKTLFDERLLGKVDLAIGTNKFDKDTAVIGSYLGENNVPIVNATYDYSDFIPVKELAEYVSNYPMRFTTYFDADKNLVAGGSGITTSGFTIPLGVEFIKITIWHTDIDLFQLEIGSFSTPYQNYKLVVNQENLQIYSSKIINDGFAEVLLPSEIYLTETLESNIYLSNAVVPEFGENLDSFRVNIDSVKGAQFNRFWRYTPTIGEAGISSLSLELKNKRNPLLTKSTSLNIASKAGGSGVNRKVLLIGDSTVDGEDINIPLKAFFDADVMDITTIGTRGSTGNKHEGRSGWTVNDYATAGRIYYRFNVTSLVGIPNLYDVYSNNGSEFTVVEIDLTAGNGHISCERTSGSNNPILTASTLTKVSGIGVSTINYDTASVQSGNPFWNSTTSLFDFQKYLTDTAQTMSANDWVFIQLGINDMFGQTTIESAEIKATTMMSQLTAIMNNIQAVVPGIRIGVMMTIPPAESQDSFASNYGNSFDRELYFKTGNLVWNRKLLTDLDTAANKTAKRYVIAGNLNLDTVNNFPTATVAVNSRNANTEVIQVNSVHPSESGYAQIADSYISIIKYYL